MPWVVLTAVTLILDIFNVIKAVITLAYANAISSILAWILVAYFFCVVWSLKTEIEDKEDAKGSYPPEVRFKILHSSAATG